MSSNLETIFEWGLILGLFAILGVVGYLAYNKLNPPRPPAPSPPPPPVKPSEVFGVDLSDFVTWYDKDISVMADGTIQFNNSPLTAEVLTANCPGGYSVATIEQLFASIRNGMQCCGWGICQSESSINIIGTYPMQVGVISSASTLCGTYDSTALIEPRVVTVTSATYSSAPTIVWIYGIKPDSETGVFRFTTDDATLPGRKIYPWYQPLPGESAPMQWKSTPSSSLCPSLTSKCAFPWTTTVNGTPMYLAAQFVSNVTVPYLTLSTQPTQAWQLLPNGYLITPWDAEVGAASYPTAYEGYPVGLVTFPTAADIVLQPPKQGDSGVNPVGGSVFTQNANGTITLSAFPSYGLGYGTAVGLTGSYIILTQTTSQWLSFSPSKWNE